MKEIPLERFGKGLGVCSKGVLKQPLKNVEKLMFGLNGSTIDYSSEV